MYFNYDKPLLVLDLGRQVVANVAHLSLVAAANFELCDKRNVLRHAQ